MAAVNESELDERPLRFGKYKGLTPKQIAKNDPSYITWLRANVLPVVVSRDLAQDCQDALDDVDVDLGDIDD